jgi:NitT/TauT family transport system ATP-binding protein
MIEISNLAVSYGTERALDGISLQVPKNSTCAIIGPSGCGKTTLLYSLAALIKPSQGTINVDGQELKDIRRATGVILQDYGLLPWKNVWSNIAFPLQCRKLKTEEINKRVVEVLNKLHIYEYKDKLTVELSGGQKQRVAIARTLVLEPDLMLMDEPSSALDALTKEHMQNLVFDIYKERAMTLVLVTHNIEEAVFLGQRIVVMGKSKIKKIIDNPYFGMKDLRQTMDFYKVCLEVRKCLYEDN